MILKTFDRPESRAKVAAAALLLAACSGDLTLPDDGAGDGGEPVGEASITVQEGDGQEGVVGEMLSTPLVVRVTADGEPVPGQGVVFEADEGHGDVAPDTTVTNTGGEATSRWTLGVNPGSQSASARLIAVNKVVRFTAAAAVGAPVTLEMVSGDGQSAEPFEPLPAPLVVEVTDRFGNPVAGVSVDWEVSQGRGELSEDETTTGADGRTQVDWTLGFFLGTQQATATVEGLDGSPVTFRASIF